MKATTTSPTTAPMRSVRTSRSLSSCRWRRSASAQPRSRAAHLGRGTPCCNSIRVVRSALSPRCPRRAGEPSVYHPYGLTSSSWTSNYLTKDELVFARESLDQLNGDHPLGDAFFDYNSDTLRSDPHSSLAKDATRLGRWKTTKITMSGIATCGGRQSTIWPWACVAPMRSRLLGVPRHRGGPHRDGELRQGAALLTDEGVSCWTQESTRTLRDYGNVAEERVPLGGRRSAHSRRMQRCHASGVVGRRLPPYVATAWCSGMSSSS